MCCTGRRATNRAMNDITRQILRVQRAIEAGTVTKAKLAYQAGLRRSVMTGIEDEGWCPKADTLAKLVDAMDALGVPTRPRLSRGNGESRAA